MPEYNREIAKIVQPMLSYVNGFCTHMFSSFTLEELEAAIVEAKCD